MQKLANSGFVDIEDEAGRLKKHHANKFPSQAEFAPKQRYYELASALLYTFPFSSSESKAIWKRHAAGQTNMEIATGMGLKYQIVQQVIEHISSHIKDV